MDLRFFVEIWLLLITDGTKLAKTLFFGVFTLIQLTMALWKLLFQADMLSVLEDRNFIYKVESTGETKNRIEAFKLPCTGFFSKRRKNQTILNESCFAMFQNVVD